MNHKAESHVFVLLEFPMNVVDVYQYLCHEGMQQHWCMVFVYTGLLGGETLFSVMPPPMQYLYNLLVFYSQSS